MGQSRNSIVSTHLKLVLIILQFLKKGIWRIITEPPNRKVVSHWLQLEEEQVG